MVHRPGLEHTRLTPSNAEELLFDDVIWVKRAKAEHDAFCEAMRDRGVEVFYAEQLLAEVLEQPEARDWLLDHVLAERQVGARWRERAREWARRHSPAEVADYLIGGIPKPTGARPRGSPAGEPARPRCSCRRCRTSCSSATRRAGSTSGVTLNPMAKPARVRETVFLEAIYRFHPMFAGRGEASGTAASTQDWGRATVEGGDVMPIGNGAVMIGMGERTAPPGRDADRPRAVQDRRRRAGDRGPCSTLPRPTCTSTR